MEMLLMHIVKSCYESEGLAEEFSGSLAEQGSVTPMDLGFLCHSGVPFRHTLFTRCVVKNWRMAAIFLHAVAQQGVLRDGCVSLLSVQSSIHIAPKT